MNPEFVGHFDVMITYAGEDAVSFFKNNGFTDDPILNARYPTPTPTPLVCFSHCNHAEITQVPTFGRGLGISYLTASVVILLTFWL